MPSRKDEIRYCDRCGISYLWSQEEQRHAGSGAERPALCPGCRYALPARERERGLVKWYSARKQYGFIIRADHPDIFAHRSQLEGTRGLRTGDLVEFGVGEGKKGPIAVGVRLIQPAQGGE